MSNVCLMGVGEASIKLIVDHWVNFSYLENPSFTKCCECGGYDGRVWVKTEGWLASNTALCSGTTFIGFTDSNDSDDEVIVLMIVLVWRSDFSFFIRGVQYVHYHVSNSDTVCVEIWSLMSSADCRLLNILFSICFFASREVLIKMPL